MVYFGTTDIPGLFNVADNRGVLIATDVTFGQLKQLAYQHGGAEFVPPPVPMVDLPGGISFPLSDICK